jgi:uncharacterized protein YyaL (SSP411 family)
VGPYPMGAAELLLAVQAISRSGPVVAIVGDPELEETREMIRAARSAPLPHLVSAFRSDLSSEGKGPVVPVLRDRASREGRPLAYVCIDQVCEVPLDNVEELIQRLSDLAGKPGSPEKAEDR